MTPRATRPRLERQVAVDVKVDGPRQVAGLVGPPPRSGLAEDPADVDDPDIGLADVLTENVGGDQWRSGPHRPSVFAGWWLVGDPRDAGERPDADAQVTRYCVRVPGARGAAQ